MAHHLILIRELDPQRVAAGCCGRIDGFTDSVTKDECISPERRQRLAQVGEVYRAVRETFGNRVEITIVDPHNFVSLIPLVIRDAVRFDVPALTALKAILSLSLSSGIFDGQLMFRGAPPPAAEVVASIAGRLEIDRVGTDHRPPPLTAPPR